MREAEVDRRIALERRDAAREALTRAADAVKRLAGNDLYQKAWRRAAMTIETMREREFI